MLTTARSELDWELEATRRVGSVTTPLIGLDLVWEQDPREFLAAVSDLEEASGDGLVWLRDHPCADSDLEAQLARLFASQSLALASLSVAFRIPRPTDQQLDDAGASVTESMRSVAASLDYLRGRLPVA